MKLLFPTGQARPFYDRNASYSGITYESINIAPHPLTVDAIYTVPANKRALITTVSMYWKRLTAAGTPGLVKISAFFDWTSNTGFIAHLGTMKNAVNDLEIVNFPCEIWMSADMSLQLQSEILGVGGTSEIIVSATYIEFGL